MAHELEEEVYVRELLAERFGAVLQKVPAFRVEGEKTADYDLLEHEQRAAVLEVKRLEHAPRTAANGWKPAYGGVTRNDNAPARVAARIHDAWTQLGGYASPKVLVLVNDDWGIDSLDLVEAVNGFLDYGTEEVGYYRNIASRKIAEGRIRDEKGGIDLYVWIDRWKASQPTFRFMTETGYELGQRFFGCPELSLPENAPQCR